MEPFMPDDIIKFKASDIINMISDMQVAHDELIIESKKLADMYAQNEKKILCYESGVEILNQLLLKADKVDNEENDQED